MNEDLDLGPVDFILLEFPDDGDQTGAGAAELRQLVEHGVIDLFDIVAVRKDAGGVVASFDLGEFSADDADGFAYFAGARSGLLDDDDVQQAGAALGNNTLGVLLMYENAWAQRFVTATRAAGGAMIATSRIPAQDLLEALDRDNN